jgi:hypothetical protein
MVKTPKMNRLPLMHSAEYFGRDIAFAHRHMIMQMGLGLQVHLMPLIPLGLCIAVARGKHSSGNHQLMLFTFVALLLQHFDRFVSIFVAVCEEEGVAPGLIAEAKILLNATRPIFDPRVGQHMPDAGSDIISATVSATASDSQQARGEAMAGSRTKDVFWSVF